MLKLKGISITVILFVISLVIIFSLESQRSARNGLFHPKESTAFEVPMKTANDADEIYYPHDPTTVMAILTITEQSVDMYCALVKQNQTVVMYSNGGSVFDGMRLGHCLRANNIKLIVVKSYSISPAIALMQHHVCIAADAKIGSHRPGYATKTMDRHAEQTTFNFVYNEIVSAGVLESSARIWIGFMDAVPNISMRKIDIPVFAAMLGDSYEGECKPNN